VEHTARPATLFYGTPSEGDASAELFALSRIPVTRQLRYSQNETRALDLCMFLNESPKATFEHEDLAHATRLRS